MFSKSLQGTTVEKVYWAVRAPSWMPTTGVEFDSPLTAKKYAEDAVSANSPKASVETRMVFRFPEGHPRAGTFDIAVETVYVEYYELIREPLPEDRY